MNEPVKSSFCDRGDCVEVSRRRDGKVVIASTVYETWIACSQQEWEAFLVAAKTGEFDNV